PPKRVNTETPEILRPERAPEERSMARCGSRREGIESARFSPCARRPPRGRVHEETPMGEAWIIDAVRTPRGKGKKDTGALSGIHPQALLAQCLNALQARNGFDRNHVEDVVAGCVSDVNDQAGCIARNAVLAAGWDP